VLRHRSCINYAAEAQGQSTETVDRKLIDTIPLHAARRTDMAESNPYLKPEVLARIVKLGLRAQRVVEGTISGLHRSPLHGVSVEFADYREYRPGTTSNVSTGAPTRAAIATTSNVSRRVELARHDPARCERLDALRRKKVRDDEVRILRNFGCIAVRAAHQTT
jgi:hypothetical protein